MAILRREQKHIKHVVIGASDQVPFWFKTNSSQTRCASFETQVAKQVILRKKRKLEAKASPSELEGADAADGATVQLQKPEIPLDGLAEG